MPGLGMAYDVFDRATTVTTVSTTVTAYYDAFGRRIERRVGTARKIFFYDTGGRLLADYDTLAEGWGPSRRIEYFAGHRVGEYGDRTGNVRYSTTGQVWRHYYPFGEEITGTASDNYKFADLYRDADTGLDYAVNRYNSSTLGRFLSFDSGGIDSSNPQRWSRYSYALNDPINYVDRNGREPFIIVDPEPCDLPDIHRDPPFPSPPESQTGSCVGPGTKTSNRSGPLLCDKGDAFVEEWRCPTGCSRQECESKAADYGVECRRRGDDYYAYTSTIFGFSGLSVYSHCCRKSKTTSGDNFVFVVVDERMFLR